MYTILKFVFFAFAASSHGASPNTDQLLEEARINRSTYAKTLSTLENKAKQAEYPALLFSYIKILPEMIKIGKKHKIEDWGIHPKSTCALVVNQATKWLRIDHDDSLVLQTFFLYGDNDPLVTVAKDHQFHLSQDTDELDLLFWLKQSIIINGSLEKLDRKTYVKEAYEKLQVDIIKKIIASSELEYSKNLYAALEQLKSPGALFELTLGISNQLMSETNADQIKHLHDLNLKAYANILDRSDLPAYILKSVAENHYRSILKSMTLGINLPFSKSINVLNKSDLNTLLEFRSIIYDLKPELLNIAQLTYANKLCTLLLKRLANIHYREKVKLTEFSYQLALSLMNKKGTKLEGVYRVKAGSKVGTLTITRVDATYFAIGLRLYMDKDQQIYHDYSFFNVIYDPKKNKFLAHRKLVDNFRNGIPIERMYFLSLKYNTEDEGKTLQGVFDRGDTHLKIQATRKSNYKILTKHIAKQPSQYSGQFKGSIHEKPVELNITQAGASISATFYYGKYRLRIPFNYGYPSPNKKELILTSGESEIEKMFHIKLKYLSDEAISIAYIKGGEGVFFDNVILRRKK